MCVSSSPVRYEAFLQKHRMAYYFALSLIIHCMVPCCPAKTFCLAVRISGTFITELLLDVQHDLEHSSRLTFVTGRHFLVEPSPGSGVECLLSCAVAHRCPCLHLKSSRSHRTQLRLSTASCRAQREHRAEGAWLSLQVLGVGLLKLSVSVIAAQWESSPVASCLLTPAARCAAWGCVSNSLWDCRASLSTFNSSALVPPVYLCLHRNVVIYIRGVSG